MPKHDAHNPAEIAAAQAQDRVNMCIDDGKNFRLEAGAGAGKTYSLVTALKQLIAERGDDYVRKGQKVACITFTNVARDEILCEIDEHPAVLVETIHAFCWRFMGRFQTQLRSRLPEFDRYKEKIAEVGDLGNRAIEYDLGFFGIHDDKVTLYHDDVPELMAKLLDLPKFRQLLVSSYPVIFIDEYQDTDAAFMAALSQHFFAEKSGPLIGLFGDHWQTIFRDDFDLAAFPNVEGIDKGSNFRSVPAVVKVLNRLRPGLKQAVKDPEAAGEARAFHTNSYVGPRTDDRNSKGDTPPDVSRAFLSLLRQQLIAEGWDFAPEKTKILMLTHNALATEQGYRTIVEIFRGSRNDSFAKKEDSTINFLADVVEPMCQAYEAKRYGQMFQLLGRPQAIKSHSDKKEWAKDMQALNTLRANGTIGQVLDHLKKTHRPRITDPVMRREDEMAAYDPESGEEEKPSTQRHRRLRDVKYAELKELSKFVEGYTPFATQHSVKGAEFENILVVLGGGWNHYNWPRMLDLMHADKIPPDKKQGYHRARNLFYVGISRPKKKLAVLFTQTLPANSLASLEKLFEPGNIHGLKLS